MAPDGRVLGIDSERWPRRQARRSDRLCHPGRNRGFGRGRAIGARQSRGGAFRRRRAERGRCRQQIKARAGVSQRSAVEIIERGEGSAAQRADLRARRLDHRAEWSAVVDAGGCTGRCEKWRPDSQCGWRFCGMDSGWSGRWSRRSGQGRRSVIGSRAAQLISAHAHRTAKRSAPTCSTQLYGLWTLARTFASGAAPGCELSPRTSDPAPAMSRCRTVLASANVRSPQAHCRTSTM